MQNKNLQDQKEYLSLYCRLLTSIQRDKCLLHLLKYFETTKSFDKSELIKIYNLSSECVFLTDGKKCDKKMYQNRLCKKHFKL